METINRKVFLIAIIMGLFTTALIYTYIKTVTKVPVTIEYTKVYVSVRNIMPREKITDKDIKEVQIAKQFVNSKAELNKAEIINRMAKEAIIEGEQILKARLVNGQNAALAFNIPEGKRAVAINVKEDTEVANFIKTGDFVDIIATFEEGTVENGNQKIIYPKITEIILQNIQILGIGQRLKTGDENSTEIPKTVTLAVTPVEAEKLSFTEEYGKIKFALKRAGDRDTIETPGVIRSEVVSDKGTTVK